MIPSHLGQTFISNSIAYPGFRGSSDDSQTRDHRQISFRHLEFFNAHQRVLQFFCLYFQPTRYVLSIMNMPKKGIITGLSLIILGVGTYFASGRIHYSALTPAYFGIPILLASLLATNPKRRKLGMHIAVTFALLGFIATLGRLVRKFILGEFEMNLANGATIIMSFLCLVFTIRCIKSFTAARRSKQGDLA